MTEEGAIRRVTEQQASYSAKHANYAKLPCYLAYLAEDPYPVYPPLM
jgi:hypothetical protein